MSAVIERQVQDVDNFLNQDGDENKQTILNGNVLFSEESVENEPTKPERIIRKAKRLINRSPKKEDGEETGVNNQWSLVNGHTVHRVCDSKNSRKSRNSKGRGLPKKGGAGGKGVWGKPGSELFGEVECKDEHDPNYDSDCQGAYVVQKVDPMLTEEEVSRTVEPILQEYLENGDLKEVQDLLKGLNFGANKHKIPEMAISIAMERHDPHREMTSQLISGITGPVVSQDELAKAFDGLLGNLEDMALDTPEAPKLLGQFIARAVADDCLPSTFVTCYKGKADNINVRTAVDKADVLLNMNTGHTCLDNVWGIGGGNRPVKSLLTKMVLLLKEYLNSGDISEATHCLQELDVPHFHHELVYQAAVMAIEESTDQAAEAIVKILVSLTSSNVITPNQFSKGVRRVYDDMPDICIDVPTAYCLLERLGNKLQNADLLTEDLQKEMPIRGRKRFVSEGDGGKVKENGKQLQ